MSPMGKPADAGAADDVPAAPARPPMRSAVDDLAREGSWPMLGGPRAVAADPHVLREWAGDPRPFRVLAVMLHSAEVEARRRTAARALHPWCRRTTPGQAHVTVAVLGEAGAEAVAGLPIGRGVEVAVGGADSFASAAFLHAQGDGLAELRARALVLLAGAGEAGTATRWVPHVTVGTYRYPIGASHIRARLAPWRALPAVRAVGRLAVVEVDRRCVAGRLVELRPVR